MLLHFPVSLLSGFHTFTDSLHSQTGAMRLGKDALVLTQTDNSRSIAFLSQSLNEGKDVCHFICIVLFSWNLLHTVVTFMIICHNAES